MSPDPADVMALVPRTRRAIGDYASTLDDTQVKGIIADAVAEVIFYSSGAFQHQLLVASRDDLYGAPAEWTIDPVLSEPEATVVTAQAALDYYFHTLNTIKTAETISDEGQTWTWEISASAVAERLKELREARDRALNAVLGANPVPTMFASFIEERDRLTSWLIEPPGGEPYFGQYLVI